MREKKKVACAYFHPWSLWCGSWMDERYQRKTVLVRTLYGKIQFKKWDLRAKLKEFFVFPNFSSAEIWELVGPVTFLHLRIVAGTHTHAMYKGTPWKKIKWSWSIGKVPDWYKWQIQDIHLQSRYAKGAGSWSFSTEWKTHWPSFVLVFVKRDLVPSSLHNWSFTIIMYYISP